MTTTTDPTGRRPGGRRPTRLTTAPAAAARGSAVAPVRNAWRQLASMRTALLLLFLLALASVPGSFLPQRSLNPVEVQEYFVEHPTLAPLLDRLSLFDAFAAPWFAAIYLLLFVSLIGCLSAALRLHARALRTPPPPVPRVLARLPVHERWESTQDADAVLADARRTLRRARWRVVERPLGGGRGLSAEKGYLRETGNLLFHVSLVLLLVGIALGGLFGFKGTVLVKEGDGFSNTVFATTTSSPAAASTPTASCPSPSRSTTSAAPTPRTERPSPSTRSSATPRAWRADDAVRPAGEPPARGRRRQDLPARPRLRAEGRRQGPRGQRLEQTVVCLPQGASFLSTCVIKVPDAAGSSSPSRACSPRRPCRTPRPAGSPRSTRRPRTPP